MRDELFSGFSETGWDEAPWDAEPRFTADELQILLNPTLSAAEAAERVGCVVATFFGCAEQPKSNRLTPVTFSAVLNPCVAVSRLRLMLRA